MDERPIVRINSRVNACCAVRMQKKNCNKREVFLNKVKNPREGNFWRLNCSEEIPQRRKVSALGSLRIMFHAFWEILILVYFTLHVCLDDKMQMLRRTEIMAIKANSTMCIFFNNALPLLTEVSVWLLQCNAERFSNIWIQHRVTCSRNIRKIDRGRNLESR